MSGRTVWWPLFVQDSIIHIARRVAAVFILTNLACVTASGAADLRFKAARFTVADGHTKLEIAVPDGLSFSAMTLKDKNQIVIELPRLGTDLRAGKTIRGKGLVASYVVKKAATGNLQLVLNTTGPVVISRSAITPDTKGKSATLLIDLAEGDVAVAARSADSIETAAFTPASFPPPSIQRRTIVLDPGHGGIDPGAVSSDGTREKDIVLAYAQAMRDALEATGRFNVVLTRTDDTFLKLEDRVKFAHDHKADLFVAIHADMLNDQSVRGTTVYTVSEKASDDVAEALAKKENGSDVLAGVGIDLGNQKQEVTSTLINLLQRESKAQALHFAKLTVNEIKPVGELTSQPMRSAAFAVLKAPDVPSVLIELGYLSNTTDKSMLNSPQWRKQMAAAMTRATVGFFSDDLTAASQ